MAIISCGTRLCLGLSFKLSSSFNPSSGNHVCVNISLLEPVSSVVISVSSSPFSPQAHQIFSPGSLGACKLGGHKNEMKCPYSPCALPSSFSFSSLFLETQQILTLLLLSVPGTNLSPLWIKWDASHKLPRAHLHWLPHFLFLLHTLFIPFFVQPPQETPNSSPVCVPLVPQEGDRDLSVWVSR